MMLQMLRKAKISLMVMIMVRETEPWNAGWASHEDQFFKMNIMLQWETSHRERVAFKAEFLSHSFIS